MIRFKTLAWFFALSMLFFSIDRVNGDGKVVPRKRYSGSLEERAQEAMIVFCRGDSDRSAVEDLILKIQVEGKAREFAWIIPFPNEPEVFKEDPKLFRELFRYVNDRNVRTFESKSKSDNVASPAQGGVKVLSKKVVGDFDITVIQETEQGGLNPWLAENGYQALEDQDGVLEFYRNKGYVYACIKVAAEALEAEGEIESHPLRFRFETGGIDGIYFPMKLTGLQTESFDINLYIFHTAWINDELNEFGFVNRGFELVFRDYDSPSCEANAGKAYSAPRTDPYLKKHDRKLKTVSELFQRLYPGKRFYLTNLQATQLKPENVRTWADDLWVFPYYTDRRVVPFDVRDNGPASTAWPDRENQTDVVAPGPMPKRTNRLSLSIMVILVGVLVLFLVGRSLRRNSDFQPTDWPKGKP